MTSLIIIFFNVHIGLWVVLIDCALVFVKLLGFVMIHNSVLIFLLLFYLFLRMGRLHILLKARRLNLLFINILSWNLLLFDERLWWSHVLILFCNKRELLLTYLAYVRLIYSIWNILHIIGWNVVSSLPTVPYFNVFETSVLREEFLTQIVLIFNYWNFIAVIWNPINLLYFLNNPLKIVLRIFLKWFYWGHIWHF